MRVFFCTTFLHFGAGRVLVDLAKFIKGLGHDVVIAATQKVDGFSSQQNLISEAEDNVIPVYLCEDIFTRDFTKISESSRLLAQLMKKEKFDVIHSFAAIPGFASTLASREAYGFGLPHISSVNGWSPDKKAWMKLQDILFLNNVDIIHAGSYDVQNFLMQEGAKADLVKTIYNGCDFGKIDRFIKNSGGKLLNNSKLRIGTVAELSERKNIQQLLRSIAILPEDVKDNIEVVIVGDGPLREYLEELAKNLKIEELVNFTGYVTDYYKYMRGMDLFVLPSRSEGLPVVLVEAMYMKIPVIATCVQGNKEIAGDNRGVLVPIDDTTALMNEIASYYYNPHVFSQRINQAFAWVVENFTQETCFGEIVELYEKMLQENV